MGGGGSENGIFINEIRQSREDTVEPRCDSRDHVSVQRGQPDRRGAGISSVLPARELVGSVEEIRTCRRPGFLSPNFGK